jgi:hypothetical protein
MRLGAMAWSLTAVADNLRGVNVSVLAGWSHSVCRSHRVPRNHSRAARARRCAASGRHDRELGIAREISLDPPQSSPDARVAVAARYRPMAAVGAFL